MAKHFEQNGVDFTMTDDGEERYASDDKSYSVNRGAVLIPPLTREGKRRFEKINWGKGKPLSD